MTAKKKPTKKPARPGAQWSEEDYAAHGYGRMSLRLPQRVLDQLAEKAEAAGCSRAELVSLAIAGYVVDG